MIHIKYKIGFINTELPVGFVQFPILTTMEHLLNINKIQLDNTLQLV